MNLRLANLDLAILGLALCAFAQTLGVAYVVTQVPLVEKGCQLLMWCGVSFAGITTLRRRINGWAWIVLPAVVLALLLQRYNNGGSAFLQGLVLIISASRFDFRQVCRALFVGALSASLVVLTLFLVGVSNSGIGRRNGISLGFGHPNTAGRVVLICYLLWICGYKTAANVKWTQGTLVGGAVFVVTGSRTSAALILLAPFVVLVARKLSKRARVYSGILIGLLPLILLVFTYATAQLLPISSFVNQLDLLLSNRIFLNYYAFSHNDLTLFGQMAQLTDSSGTIYNNIRNFYNWSVTIDSTYAVMLISYGVVPSIIFAVCAFIACRRAGRAGDVLALTAAFMLVIYAFNESQMISVTNSFFLFFAMTRMSSSKRISKFELAERQHQYSSIGFQRDRNGASV